MIFFLKQKLGSNFLFNFSSNDSCFFFFFRLGNGAFCWAREDREAMTDVSIVLAADGKGKSCPNVIERMT